MIPFQQILDTTRLAGDICCPGDKYWVTTLRETNLPCDLLAGGYSKDSGAFMPFGPSMRIDPDDGSYHFYTGSDHVNYLYDCWNIYQRGAVAFNRNGEPLDQKYYLPPLNDAYTDRCSVLVEGWNSPSEYYTKGGKVVVDGCLGMFTCINQSSQFCGYDAAGKDATMCYFYGKNFAPMTRGFIKNYPSYQQHNITDTNQREWAGPNRHIKKGDLPALSGSWQQNNPQVSTVNGCWASALVSGSTTTCLMNYGWETGTHLWGDDADPHTLQYGFIGGACRCCCCRFSHQLYAVSYEKHPEQVNCAFANPSCNVCICRSTLYFNIPQQCGIQFNKNTLPFNQYSTMARKPFDIAEAGDGIYVAMVSNQAARYNCSSTHGLSPMFCLYCDTCAAVNSCPKYQRPNGIVTKYDLPSWDGTAAGFCFCWSGKTWYMHNDEITGKCSQLSVRDLYFRDNKIIVKPITYAGGQECFCCFNGATAHPTVIFCECNCNVRYLSFTSLSTNSPVVADMIYTTRGTWIAATPTYNASWSQNTGVCPTPSKAYGAITISEWNEDWTTCYGAIDICNLRNTTTGFVNGGTCCVGGRNYCCDYANYSDFNLDYDPIDDSIIFSFSNPGSCCCYTSQVANQVGITVMKLPGEIAITCDWAKRRLEQHACNVCCSQSCVVCGSCGTGFACFWPGANGGFNDCFFVMCGGSYNTPTGFTTLACSVSILDGVDQGFQCSRLWINPSNNPLISVTCATMACCQFNPDCWFNGCLSGWAVGSVPGWTCSQHWKAQGYDVRCMKYNLLQYTSTCTCASCFSAATPACKSYRTATGSTGPYGGGRNPREARVIGSGCCNCLVSAGNLSASSGSNHRISARKTMLPICDYS